MLSFSRASLLVSSVFFLLNQTRNLWKNYFSSNSYKNQTTQQSIEKAFVDDPVGALPAAVASAPLSPESALDTATAEYLAHSGKFAAARELVLEAGLFGGGDKNKKKKEKDNEAEEQEQEAKAAADALVAPFVEAERVLSRLRFPNCDAEPALEWLASKRAAAAKKKKKKGKKESDGGGDGGGISVVVDEERADALEFSLLRARFASVLAGEGPGPALRFVRERMARFARGGGGGATESATAKTASSIAAAAAATAHQQQQRQQEYLSEIGRLMGAVAFFDAAKSNEAATTTTTRTRSASAAAAANHPSSSSSRKHLLPDRYKDLFSRALWESTADELSAVACELAGVPARAPLLVAAAAGAAALPTLLKLASKVSAGASQPGSAAAALSRNAAAAAASRAAARGAAGAPSAGEAARLAAEISSPRLNAGDNKNEGGEGGGEEDEGLPIDLNLGPEFAFTTIFSCPVSRDTATRDNPPMLLPCGHVFCRTSVAGISVGRGGGPASSSRAFKCPLCPTEATPGSCRALVFPPLGAAAALASNGGGGGKEHEEEEEEEEDEREPMAS